MYAVLHTAFAVFLCWFRPAVRFGTNHRTRPAPDPDYRSSVIIIRTLGVKACLYPKTTETEKEPPLLLVFLLRTAR